MDWKNIHRFQEKPGWCGPAVIQMVLYSAGIKKSQEEIAKDVYFDWWGTSQDILLAYLSRFFGDIGFSQNSTIPQIEQHLKDKHIIIVNWWDDMDDGEPEGHYTIVAGKSENKISMVDPSNSRSGIWEMNLEEFEKRWFDYLDVNKKIKIERWLLWANPSSKL